MKNGAIIEINGHKWTVLEYYGNGTVKCTGEDIGEKQFDEKSNNYANSEIRKYLNTEFLKELEEVVGAENIIPFERDLTALDGRKDYGICIDKVSIISFDEQRKYVEYVPELERWSWTLTPWSVESNGDKYWLSVVSPSADFCSGGCCYYLGVRPVCIFSPSIFESGVAKEIE